MTVWDRRTKAGSFYNLSTQPIRCTWFAAPERKTGRGVSSTGPRVLCRVRYYFRVPLPLSDTFTVPPLVVAVSVAARDVAAAGVKVKTSVQLCPAARAEVSAQLPERAKSVGLLPPKVRALIASVPPPALERVTVFAALVVPTFWLPKLIEVAVSLARGAGATGAATVAAATLTRNVLPPNDRLALSTDVLVFAATE